MQNLNPQRICLIRTSAIGDTVHALALINALRKGYPDAHLTWVLQTLPFEMVRHQPGIDQFITFRRKSSLNDWRLLLSQLRRERFDLLIAPQASAKVSLLTLFSRAANKLGFDWKRSREMHWLVTNRHIPQHPMQHVQDQFLEFAHYLDIPKTPLRWDFYFTAQERAWQKDFFSRFRKPIIGFVIASAHPQKDWSPNHYAQLVNDVFQNLKMQPMLIGGPSQREQEIAQYIVSKCVDKPVVALETPIRRTMLQLDGCRLVVSPDTGPLHISVALNTPTIGLYGYSNPKRCGPYTFRDLLIDAYNMDEPETAPITRKTKPGRMELIEPEAVIQRIEYALSAYPLEDTERNTSLSDANCTCEFS